MRVFVTGASGWIGGAAVAYLLAADHEVVGLARSDESARAIEALGASVHRGALDDPASLAAGAEASDGVVHLAYFHDFSQIEKAAEMDLAAVRAMGTVLAGTGRPLLIASGTLGLRPGAIATEEDTPARVAHPRMASAFAALDLVDEGVRSVILRFAPTVHGPGDHGFLATLVSIARQRGVSGYVEDGINRWPAVHRLDAGELVAMALDRAPAGSNVHAVAEEGVQARAIAESIGRHLGIPTASIPVDRAEEHFSWMGRLFGADVPASSAITRQTLGWEPRHPTLLADLDEGSYFSG